MFDEISFGNFVRHAHVHQEVISYNDLTAGAGKNGKYLPKKMELNPIETMSLLGPYFSVRLFSQMKAVIPLALYLMLFQVLILRQSIADHWVISAGLIAVIIGLMIFMEGLKLGLMPFAEIIGVNLPKKSGLGMVLFLSFLLGIGVTFAEPAIGAIQQVGSKVSVEEAPYLYAVLNNWTSVLVLLVGVGVGLAAVVGTMRFLYGWSLKPLVYSAVAPTIILTIYCMLDPQLSKVIGLAWDCGAATTGPITVPLVLSLGVGISAAAGKGGSSLSGFGIVTLASLFPITGVLGLSVYVSLITTPQAIINSVLDKMEASTVVGVVSNINDIQWYEISPIPEIMQGTQAIVPLVIFLLIILRVVLKQKLREAGIVTYGLFLTLLGMIIFLVGLSYGLSNLGGQSGGFVPAAFMEVEHVDDSPMYIYGVGLAIAILFAWVLGFGATLAEPALNALGQTVENLTSGAFKKSMLMYSVSIGVGFGISLGIIKIIFDVPLPYMLLPCYAVALVLTFFSSEEFVNVAWDSAGVTTGPITVPLVFAMGLGFGNAVDAVEGFGILAMASICPILSVLITDILMRIKSKHFEEKIEEHLEDIADGKIGAIGTHE